VAGRFLPFELSEQEINSPASNLSLVLLDVRKSRLEELIARRVEAGDQSSLKATELAQDFAQEQGNRVLRCDEAGDRVTAPGKRKNRLAIRIHSTVHTGDRASARRSHPDVQVREQVLPIQTMATLAEGCTEAMQPVLDAGSVPGWGGDERNMLMASVEDISG
jgi:hypothetical protein